VSWATAILTCWQPTIAAATYWRSAANKAGNTAECFDTYDSGMGVAAGRMSLRRWRLWVGLM